MKPINGITATSRFPELEDKDLKSLYGHATVKRLQAGDRLIEEGESDLRVYLFLEGRLGLNKRLNGENKAVVQIIQERGKGGIAIFGQNQWPVSIGALEPSILLSVDQNALEDMNDRIKLYFHKRRHRIDYETVSRLIEKQADLDRKYQYHQTYLFAAHNQHRPDYSQSELISGILKKIPRLPAFAGTLAAELVDDDVSSKTVSDKVKQDPSLAANLLKIINSPYYSFGRRISDINHAVMLLGFNELYQLVIDEGIQRVMPNSSVFRDILSHSNCISRIAFALSLSAQKGKPSEISTIGLLHDLGKSIQHLLKRQNRKLELLIDELDPSLIGGRLLRTWNLPNRVWQTIEFQEHPKFASPASIPEPLLPNVALLYVSHQCFETIWGKNNGLASPYRNDYFQILGFGDKTIQAVTKQHLIPALLKTMDGFPAFFRKRLTTYMRTHMAA